MPDGHEDQTWEAGEALLGVVPPKRGKGPCEERKSEMGSHDSCWLLNPAATPGGWKDCAHFTVE